MSPLATLEAEIAAAVDALLATGTIEPLGAPLQLSAEPIRLAGRLSQVERVIAYMSNDLTYLSL